MKVKRIVANVDTRSVDDAKRFYQRIFGLELLMDHGWIATYGNAERMDVQISFASQGGSGTPTPTCRSRSTTSMKRSHACRRPGFRSNTARLTSRGACGGSMCVIRSASWSTCSRIADAARRGGLTNVYACNANPFTALSTAFFARAAPARRSRDSPRRRRETLRGWLRRARSKTSRARRARS